MSCGKRCYERDDKWNGHTDCSTCPDQDSGPTSSGCKYCASCGAWHDPAAWPHEPEAQPISEVKHD